MTERIVSSRLPLCVPPGCRGPRPTSREFPINSLIKVDRLAAFARKRARMWNMIKRAGDRSETDVSSSTLFLFSTKLSAQTFSLSSILFFSLSFHRSSSRFHSASTIVITLFRLTSSKFLETSNDNDGGEGGKGGGGRGKRMGVLASRKNPLIRRSGFR